MRAAMKRWRSAASSKSLDLRTLIRNRQLLPLLLNLVLASYQRQLGGVLGVVPGTDLLAAVRAAEEHDIPVRLCDRDVRVTLRRAWSSLSLWRKSQLLAVLAAGHARGAAAQRGGPARHSPAGHAVAPHARARRGVPDAEDAC